MGRRRKLSKESILQAAEEVALREGAAGLTLEAIANCAGVSKSTILYNYSTMSVLVVALTRHLLDQEEQRIAALEQALAGEADATIRARVAAADRSFTENEQSLVTMIVPALASNAELKQAARTYFERSLADVTATSTHPRCATVAFLALHGLTNLRSLGLFDWQPDDFRRLIEDIASVARNPLPDPSAPSCADRTAR